MNEAALRSILSRLGVRPGRTNSNGFMPFPCPLSPWTHKGGRDSRPSAAARVAPDGVSSFVCKGCHAHGRIAKLVNLLASYRNDDSIRPLMLEADRADAQATLTADYGEFDQPTEIDDIGEPLIEAQFDGLWDPAWSVPQAREYLVARGISERGANRCELQWEPLQQRILFPVRDRDGALYGFSGRAINPNTQPKIRDYHGLPKRHLILGEHLWQPGLPLMIVEGLFGYANLIEQDLSDIVNVGALLGSALTPQKAARIIAFDEPTYLALDPDDGGDIGLFGTFTPEGLREDNGAITRLSGHVPLFVPDWPPGIDDPDQLTRQHVQAFLQHAPLFGDMAIEPFDKAWDNRQSD